MNISKIAGYTVSAFMLLLFLSSNSYASLLDTEVFKGNTVRVTTKYPNCITITSHRLKLPSEYIIVSSSSTIKDIDGSIISLKALKLPCAAKIRYLLKNKAPDALLIQLDILEYGDRASTRFISDEPFLRLPE